MSNYHEKNLIRLTSIFISLWSVYVFIVSGHTAYDIPAVDITHYIMRFFDSEFAINDFLTNAYLDFNPRHIFIYIIIYGSKIISVHWYKFFFFLKVLIVILLPLVHFHSIYLIISNKCKTKESYYLCTFIIFAFVCYLVSNHNTLTIAWWSSMMLQVIPQSVAIILCLGSYCIYNYYKKKSISCYFIFFLGAIIHPALALFVSGLVFLISIAYDTINWKLIFLYFLISISSGLILNIFFGSESSISAIEFNYHYCEIAHPSHFIIEYFENFQEPWYCNFIITLIVLILSSIFGYFKDNKLFKFSFLSIFFYSGCLILQKITTTFFPIKIISALGPVRFSMFSTMLTSISLIWVLTFIKIPISLNIYKNFNFRIFNKIFNAFYFYLFFIALIIFCQVKLVDNPFSVQDDKMLLWIVENTPKNSVFVSFKRDVDINLKARRSLFITQAFPFNEKYFREFSKRYISVYSKRSKIERNEGFWSGEKHNRYYHSLTPESFKNLTNNYKINYLVFENKFLNSDFKQIIPCYSDNTYSIYNLNDF